MKNTILEMTIIKLTWCNVYHTNCSEGERFSNIQWERSSQPSYIKNCCDIALNVEVVKFIFVFIVCQTFLIDLYELLTDAF